jgi:hypothetical protein
MFSLLTCTFVLQAWEMFAQGALQLRSYQMCCPTMIGKPSAAGRWQCMDSLQLHSPAACLNACVPQVRTSSTAALQTFQSVTPRLATACQVCVFTYQASWGGSIASWVAQQPQRALVRQPGLQVVVQQSFLHISLADGALSCWLSAPLLLLLQPPACLAPPSPGPPRSQLPATSPGHTAVTLTPVRV